MYEPPPVGWYSFGTHVDTPQRLEFSEEKGDDGMPLWERPIADPPAWGKQVSLRWWMTAICLAHPEIPNDLVIDVVTQSLEYQPELDPNAMATFAEWNEYFTPVTQYNEGEEDGN